MSIRVEMFGIPRQRAGVAETASSAGCLGDLLSDLEARFPGLSGTCIDDGRLIAGYTANLGGEQFVTDPATVLQDGDVVLILSADAGG